MQELYAGRQTQNMSSQEVQAFSSAFVLMFESQHVSARSQPCRVPNGPAYSARDIDSNAKPAAADTQDDCIWYNPTYYIHNLHEDAQVSNHDAG